MKHNIIAINAGSSTLKFQLYSMPEERIIAKGMIDKIGKEDALFVMEYHQQKLEANNIQLDDAQQAIDYLLEQLLSLKILTGLDDIDGVGHRVAHGGDHFKQSVRIDQEVIAKLTDLCELAPLHNPVNLAFIKAMRLRLPNCKQVAVFDTSFHQTMAKPQYLYALPYRFYQEDQIRRYGFHGTSHHYVSQECAKQLQRPVEQLKIISCHLGSGASICAIENGQSVNTSMGFTPLAGLAMGTRCGDIDPSILLYIAKKHQLSLDEVNHIMNSESGLLGISGVSNDCRSVQQAGAQGNQRAQLAIDIFVQRIRDFIGAYMIQMGGVDVILFTGGIGENSASIRQAVCQNLQALGMKLDPEKNASSQRFIHQADSKIALAVINTNEELMMARQTMAL
ncbi:acetate/propionate family kinase [Agarivorans sp. QJM3NY_29]|uniref:acetate/propionate family kinase n=1 Tax=unclassified Agarivorans TaxID=2636026 RepID=UPI003D7CEFC5